MTEPYDENSDDPDKIEDDSKENPEDAKPLDANPLLPDHCNETLITLPG